MHVRFRAALAAVLAVPVVVAGVSVAAAPPKVTSGSVVLRTTDDAGTCATSMVATSVRGKRCPYVRLYYATPARPKALVVVFHGHGHNGSQYVGQLADMAKRFGVLAVAMHTQQLKAGLPSYKGPFDSVDEEARGAAAAINWARTRYQTGARTYLFGTSMGGSGLAYFIDAATRDPAGDADATWVQRMRPLPIAGLVDAEGIGSLSETWLEATGFDQVAAAEIEAETGGTPTTAPDAYRSRSLALVDALATGVKVAAVIHDVNDGLVPYNQTLETRAAFLAAGIPTRTYDVVFKDACGQGSQTTLTSNIPVPGLEDQLCLAGHANENDPRTPVMRAAVTALGEMLAGEGFYDAQVVNPTRPS